MKRKDLIDDIIYIISTYRVHSTIEVDGTTILYLCWNQCKNHIQVEGFDTENIYTRKYVNNKEVNDNKIIKLTNAPYKLLRKLHDLLVLHYKLPNKNTDEKYN
jgi:hypothetical protein